ncbi:DASH family cryptochrome [Croceiramulus getboli]|nr:DASH family cryptochrome [Flavobacteriaceae bacterium YJPT1-3]
MSKLIWFTSDLRTHDNHSLHKACESDEAVRAVYFFDPRYYQEDRFGFKKTERFRAQFIRESVAQLEQHLKKLNIPLFIYHEQPEQRLPKLVEEHHIDHLFLQKEWTQEEVDIRAAVQQALPDSLTWTEQYDQFLFHPDDIPYSDFSKIPQVFTQFRKKCEKQCTVRTPLPVPESRPQEHWMETRTSIPSLEDLGLSSFEQDPRSAFPFEGGEQAAWDRLREYFWNTKKLAYYKKTRNGLVGKDYSSKFSAWLAQGCISAPAIYQQVKKFEKEVKKNQDTYWLIFELIWRDYFKYVSLKHGNAIFHLGGILEKDYNWADTQAARKEWIDGKTKYDFVNANMREIAKTGFMSNRGRQNVASFWAKELNQDWRVGAAYFESMLIDYDVHSNWGNWMYNAGVGNDPRDRKFNIESQAERYDGDGKYRRLWLQESLEL